MQPAPAAATPPEDPGRFRYGWRFVQRVRPDGSVDVEQVPLTLEDVLHPQEDDHIPQRKTHWRDCVYLGEVFESRRPAAPPVSTVTHDLLIDWGVPGLRGHAPDIAVFVGLREEPDPESGTLHVGDSPGARCLLVVEVVSPDTRVNDVVHKVEHYHRARVASYLLIDQSREDGPRSLLGYRWAPRGYDKVAVGDGGRLHVPELRLHIGLRDNRAVCYDDATGEELGDYAQLIQQLEEADRRSQEQDRAIEEAILQRNEAERKAQDAQRSFAEAERKAQDAQKVIDEQAQRLREMEELLRKLQGGT